MVTPVSTLTIEEKAMLTVILIFGSRMPWALAKQMVYDPESHTIKNGSHQGDKTHQAREMLRVYLDLVENPPEVDEVRRDVARLFAELHQAGFPVPVMYDA